MGSCSKLGGLRKLTVHTGNFLAKGTNFEINFEINFQRERGLIDKHIDLWTTRRLACDRNIVEHDTEVVRSALFRHILN